MNKKCKAIFLCLAIASLSAFSQTKRTALAIKNEALKQETVLDAINYLNSNLNNADTASDRRSLLYFTGSLQEQLGLYSDACASYAKAAGISAGSAAGMKDVSNEQIVIDAVRVALSGGDWETADSYLNSSVRSSKNETIIAYTNLYSVWAALCRVSTPEETQDSVALLHAYSAMQSMKSVKPAVLLTLWYLTGNESYGTQIKNDYPYSPEAGIVRGEVQIASVPFWYFVPHGEVKFTPPKEEKIISVTRNNSPASAVSSKKEEPKKSSGSIMRERGAGKKQQLGFYRDFENAREKVNSVREKGFDAYCVTEKRSSGTTYYVVLVDENNTNTMGPKLKSAGFECYTVN